MNLSAARTAVSHAKMAMATDRQMTGDRQPEKCTLRSVLPVERKHKSPSSREMTDRYIAANVFPTKDNNIRYSIKYIFFKMYFFIPLSTGFCLPSCSHLLISPPGKYCLRVIKCQKRKRRLIACGSIPTPGFVPNSIPSVLRSSRLKAVNIWDCVWLMTAPKNTSCNPCRPQAAT